ncbi:hypothetical protein BDF20DRAFT_991713 [Mycotypha africana]|uniref:uncharacterized protein n=1 Tax=Mycotypha africana TaxID=64632 RepID=UPI0022FFE5D8|nr:uncharacterized protein BDF20DRAFT_991713 [Mycotypha africana]KAI8967721.1 hypothetical protein BDF20DRAFT_991713 [Mycotypha africana]
MACSGSIHLQFQFSDGSLCHPFLLPNPESLLDALAITYAQNIVKLGPHNNLDAKAATSMTLVDIPSLSDFSSFGLGLSGIIMIVFALLNQFNENIKVVHVG